MCHHLEKLCLHWSSEVENDCTMLLSVKPWQEERLELEQDLFWKQVRERIEPLTFRTFRWCTKVCDNCFIGWVISSSWAVLVSLLSWETWNQTKATQSREHNCDLSNRLKLRKIEVFGDCFPKRWWPFHRVITLNTADSWLDDDVVILDRSIPVSSICEGLANWNVLCWRLIRLVMKAYGKPF